MAFDEGRVYQEYHGLERMDVDVDAISHATYLKNFTDFICKAEPQWDVDKKNQLFYQCVPARGCPTAATATAALRR